MSRLVMSKLEAYILYQTVLKSDSEKWRVRIL